MIERMQIMHEMGFIYRDVKPDNFLIGQYKKQTIVFMIDMGLVKRYKDPKSGKHVTEKPVKFLTGTARYASMNSHMIE
jgi:serine/threonine protein kinase